MGSSTHTTPRHVEPASSQTSSYVERIAEEAESAADAAEMVRVKVARHGKAQRRLDTGAKGGAR